MAIQIRKIPKDKNSTKRAYNARDKRENVGISTRILDKNNQELITGDNIRLDDGTKGVFLYNRHQNAYGLFYGNWYNKQDPLDPESYGKFILIPNDNGMRMHITKINA